MEKIKISLRNVSTNTDVINDELDKEAFEVDFERSLQTFISFVNSTTNVGIRKSQTFILTFDGIKTTFTGGRFGKDLMKVLLVKVVEDNGLYFRKSEAISLQKQAAKSIGLSKKAFEFVNVCSDIVEGTKTLTALDSILVETNEGNESE